MDQKNKHTYRYAQIQKHNERHTQTSMYEHTDIKNTVTVTDIDKHTDTETWKHKNPHNGTNTCSNAQTQ